MGQRYALLDQEVVSVFERKMVVAANLKSHCLLCEQGKGRLASVVIRLQSWFLPRGGMPVAPTT